MLRRRVSSYNRLEFRPDCGAILAELEISERTAETHVQHILDKLDISSRAHLAA